MVATPLTGGGKENPGEKGMPSMRRKRTTTRTTTGQLHFLEVDMDSLPPFFVVLGSATEQRDERVLGAGGVQGRRRRCRRLTTRRGRTHLAGSRSRQGCSTHPPVLSK